jgi:hypothetical protein
MANTYTLISTLTANAGAVSTFDFTSIPSTYTDLCVKVSGRGTVSSLGDNSFIRFNNSSTGYSYKFLYGSGSGAAGSGSGNDYPSFLMPAGTATAGTFGNAEVYIPNYASSNYKSYSVDTGMENSGSSSYVEFWEHLWSNTSAITSVKITCGGNFAQYSTAYLYGIKNS